MALLAQLGALGCGDSTDPNGTGGTGGMLFEPGPTCTAFCAKVIVECDALADEPGYEDVDEMSCQQGCERNLRAEQAFSEACGDAVEAVFSCVAELECQGVESWLAQQPAESFPCRSQVIASTNCAQN
jgi:hypothetical protein